MQNGGRHCCRPPVAGLRSAWHLRRDTRAFWFRRHAPPAPRTALGFAFRSPGSGAIPLRASTPRPPAASSTIRPKPDSLALATISGPPSTRCRATRIQPSRPTLFHIAGTGKNAWNTLPCRSTKPSLSRRRTFLRGPIFRQRHERFPCGTFSQPWHKWLMSLRFLASSSSAYSHDAVIDSESRKGANDIASLWIAWISWRRFCADPPLLRAARSDERHVVSGS